MKWTFDLSPREEFELRFPRSQGLGGLLVRWQAATEANA
jgi:hypothetical protein